MFQGLEHHATTVDDVLSSQNALFQLSICFHLGFGCKRCEVTSREYLSQSGISHEKFLEELDVIRKDDEPRHIGALHHAGADTRFHSRVSEDYKRDCILEEAYIAHQQMAMNLEQIMGELHSRVVLQKIVLAEILEMQHNETDAETLLLKALVNQNEGSWNKMRLNQTLAMLYSKTKQWNKSKAYADATDRHVGLRFAIQTFRAARDWNKLIETSQAYLEHTIEDFGDESPAVLEAIDILALAFLAARRTKESKEMFLRAIEIGERIWGPEDPVVQYCKVRIPGIMVTMKQRNVICDIGPRVLAIYKRTYGSDFKTLSITRGLADSFLWTGRILEAIPYQQETVRLRRELKGSFEMGTATAMNNLASCYFVSIQWFEAEKLQDEALRMLYQSPKGHDNARWIRLMIHMQFQLYHYRAWIIVWGLLSTIIPEKFLMWTAQALVAMLCWIWGHVCRWL